MNNPCNSGCNDNTPITPITPCPTLSGCGTCTISYNEFCNIIQELQMSFDKCKVPKASDYQRLILALQQVLTCMNIKNIGAGDFLFKDRDGFTFNFKSLLENSEIKIDSLPNELSLSVGKINENKIFLNKTYSITIPPQNPGDPTNVIILGSIGDSLEKLHDNLNNLFANIITNSTLNVVYNPEFKYYKETFDLSNPESTIPNPGEVHIGSYNTDMGGNPIKVSKTHIEMGTKSDPFGGSSYSGLSLISGSISLIANDNMFGYGYVEIDTTSNYNMNIGHSYSLTLEVNNYNSNIALGSNDIAIYSQNITLNPKTINDYIILQNYYLKPYSTTNNPKVLAVDDLNKLVVVSVPTTIDITNLQNQIDVHTLQINTLNSNITTLQTNVSNLTTNVSNIQSDINTINNQITNLQSATALQYSTISSDYTLTDSDNNKIILVNNSTNVSITISNTLSDKFTCYIKQIGTSGDVTLLNYTIKPFDKQNIISGQGYNCLVEVLNGNRFISGDLKI